MMLFTQIFWEAVKAGETGLDGFADESEKGIIPDMGIRIDMLNNDTLP